MTILDARPAPGQVSPLPGAYIPPISCEFYPDYPDTPVAVGVRRRDRDNPAILPIGPGLRGGTHDATDVPPRQDVGGMGGDGSPPGPPARRMHDEPDDRPPASYFAAATAVGRLDRVDRAISEALSPRGMGVGDDAIEAMFRDQDEARTEAIAAIERHAGRAEGYVVALPGCGPGGGAVAVRLPAVVVGGLAYVVVREVQAPGGRWRVGGKMVVRVPAAGGRHEGGYEDASDDGYEIEYEG